MKSPGAHVELRAEQHGGQQQRRDQRADRGTVGGAVVGEQQAGGEHDRGDTGVDQGLERGVGGSQTIDTGDVGVADAVERLGESLLALTGDRMGADHVDATDVLQHSLRCLALQAAAFCVHVHHPPDPEPQHRDREQGHAGGDDRQPRSKERVHDQHDHRHDRTGEQHRHLPRQESGELAGVVGEHGERSTGVVTAGRRRRCRLHPGEQVATDTSGDLIGDHPQHTVAIAGEAVAQTQRPEADRSDHHDVVTAEGLAVGEAHDDNDRDDRRHHLQQRGDHVRTEPTQQRRTFGPGEPEESTHRVGHDPAPPSDASTGVATTSASTSPPRRTPSAAIMSSHISR